VAVCIMEKQLIVWQPEEIDDLRIVEHPEEVAELEKTQDARKIQKAKSMEERRKRWNELLSQELTLEQRKAQEDAQRGKDGNLPANFRYERLEKVQHDKGADAPTLTAVKIKLAPPKRRCVRNRAPSEQEYEEPVWEDADFQSEGGEDMEEDGGGAGDIPETPIVPEIQNRKESQGQSVVQDSQAPPLVEAKTVLAPTPSLRAIIAGTLPEDMDKLPTYRLTASEENAPKNEKGQDMCFTTLGVFANWKDLPALQAHKFGYVRAETRNGYAVQDIEMQKVAAAALSKFVEECMQTFGRDQAYTTSPVELAIFANQCYIVTERRRVRNWDLNLWMEDEAGQCIVLPNDVCHRVTRAKGKNASELVIDILLIEDFDKKCFWYVQLDRVAAEEVAVVMPAA